MTLPIEEIRHLARLARLELSSQDEDLLGPQLARIVDFVGSIARVETELANSSIELQAVPEAADERPDEPQNPWLLENAPERLDRFVLIPRIVGHRDP